ncbi:signal peptidase I SipW [Paenibacillus sp. J22TS3]|uniref:signal peptidase I SipW n=1 Tax=Paenibacillus sp. J22TS3 TaxID=2807192 RepID=UPI001B2E6816|nr:signal peptidase I [Paenibacillus sp. J22TS3]GIP24048.1 S26 family signal peptidase [Paenibacillus sp. J22TS3]
MRIKKLISRTLTTLLILLFIVMAASVVISKAGGGEPNFFGYQIKTVLSGSMEPSIQTGSIVALQPGGDMGRFKVGDIITYRESADKLVTHRIIEVLKNRETGHVSYRTKGDNNDTPDLEPVPASNVTAEYTGFTIPYAGYAMNFANSRAGSVALLVIPGLLLIIYAGASSWKALSKIDKKEADSTSVEAP